MNRIYRLVFNRTLGLFQAASETSRSHGKSTGNRSPRTRRLALTAAVAALPSLALALPPTTPGTDGGTGLIAVGDMPDNVVPVTGGDGGEGNTGASGGTGGPGSTGTMGGAGGAGVAGANFTLTNSETIQGGVGGEGGVGGAGGVGVNGPTTVGPIPGGPGGAGGLGGDGGTGGVGASGSGFYLTNTGAILGGAGGGGGLGGAGGQGGRGGDDEDVVGDGGTGGVGGNGGAGGYTGAGGAGVSGNHFTLVNSGIVRGGNGSDAIGYGGQGGPGGQGGLSLFIGEPGASGAPGNEGSAGALGAGGVGVLAGGNSTIINSGTIEGGLSGDGHARANAVQLSLGGNTLEVHAGAVFVGDVISFSAAYNGGDTLAFGGENNGSFDISQISDLAGDGQFQGFAKLAKTGGSTWTFTGHSVFDGSMAVEAGTLVLNGAAFGMSPTVSVSSGATLRVSDGNIGALTNDGTVSVSAGKKLWIAGDFHNNDMLRIDLANAGSYGKISVMNTAYLDGGTLYVNVIGNPALTSGQALAQVIEAGAIDGTFDEVTTNSLLFDFSANYSATEVGLTISAKVDGGGTPSNSLIETIVANHRNNPALPAAGVLGRAFASNPGGDLALRFAALTSDDDANNAVTQSLPLLTGGSQIAANVAQSGIKQVVQGRLDASQGLSSGDGFLSDNHLWLKPFGSWADQENRNGVAGYDASVGGLAIGTDGKLSDKTLLGVSFAYANASVDSNSDVAPNKVDVDVYQLVGYGTYNLDNATAIDFQLGAGVNKNKGKRELSLFALTARADYSSVTALAGVGIGHTFALNEQLRFTPSVRADYTWIKDKGYTETGADAFNLNVDSRDTDSLILAVDGKLNYALDNTTSVSANLGAGYDTLNDRASITSAYAGAPGAAFATKGLDLDPWLLRAGVGLTHVVDNGTEISLRYEAEKRNDFLNQTASVRVRWVF